MIAAKSARGIRCTGHGEAGGRPISIISSFIYRQGHDTAVSPLFSIISTRTGRLLPRPPFPSYPSLASSPLLEVSRRANPQFAPPIHQIPPPGAEESSEHPRVPRLSRGGKVQPDIRHFPRNSFAESSGRSVSSAGVEKSYGEKLENVATRYGRAMRVTSVR